MVLPLSKVVVIVLPTIGPSVVCTVGEVVYFSAVEDERRRRM